MKPIQEAYMQSREGQMYTSYMEKYRSDQLGHPEIG